MKSIAINDSNFDAINEAVAAAEGRATERTLGYDQIEDLVDQLESNPAIAVLPKSARTGITATLQRAHKLPNSYRFAADATAVDVAWRSKNGWHLIKAYRTRNVETVNDRVDVVLTEAAATEAKKRFEATFCTES